MEKEMIKQREENGACSSCPESRKNSNEVQMRFCQSCGMPLINNVLGTNADGSKNEDYCMYCYKDGKFLQECTMDDMIEHCSLFVDAVNEGFFFPRSFVL